MSDEAIKKRQARWKEKVEDILRKTGYKIIRSDNSVFCILAVRKSEIRLVRIALDKISLDDEKKLREFQGLPKEVCTREIWCRKSGDHDFEIKEIE